MNNEAAAIAELKRRKIVGTFAGITVGDDLYYLRDSGAIMRIPWVALKFDVREKKWDDVEREFAVEVEAAAE